MAAEYTSNPEACIVCCFFNPQRSAIRLKVFRQFHESIKHLNHVVVELAIGSDGWQLQKSDNVHQLRTKSLLWHKESLINWAVARLPKSYKYIFWLDADVLFTNCEWLTDSVQVLQSHTIVQPFEFCVHLAQHSASPGLDLCGLEHYNSNRVLKSFGAAHAQGLSGNLNYYVHGHVGFAWGARREVLEATGLFDKALIGGADHIMAHASVGQIKHPCLSRTFSNSASIVEEWSNRFYQATQGLLGYTRGSLYHLWHGDVLKRDYFRTFIDFDSKLLQYKQDGQGLYTSDDGDAYVRNYFKYREV